MNRITRTFGIVSLVLLPAVLPLRLTAQAFVDISAVLPTTWASGSSAPTVRTPATEMLGVSRGWPVHHSAHVFIGGRFSPSRVDVVQPDETFNGGSLLLIDGVAGVMWRPSRGALSRLSLEVGGGTTIIFGQRNVAPFRGGSRAKPMAESTLAVTLPWKLDGRSTALLARGTFVRIGGSTTDDPVREPGTVKRMSLGARILL